MKNKILLSVLMPVFNAQEYLSVALDSVLGQTLSNFELLIIDDGSTDDSLSIIKKYAANDSRIKFLSRENKGLVATLNELVNMASAEIVARMDADDQMPPERFAEQFKVVKNSNKDIVCGSWVQTTNDLNEIWHYRQADNFTKNLLLTGITPFCHPTMMCFTSLLKENPYQKEFEYLEDYALFCQLVAERKVTFYNIPKVLYFYKIHAESICGKEKAKQKQLRIKILQRFLSDLTCISIADEACSDFLTICSLDKVSLSQLSFATLFLENIINNNTVFGDDYYALSERLLTLALKCDSQIEAMAIWQKSALFPTVFCFLKAGGHGNKA